MFLIEVFQFYCKVNISILFSFKKIPRDVKSSTYILNNIVVDSSDLAN